MTSRDDSPRRRFPGLERLEERLAPSLTFSISNPTPVPEGGSGTTNMVFVVTRSGNLSPQVR